MLAAIDFPTPASPQIINAAADIVAEIAALLGHVRHRLLDRGVKGARKALEAREEAAQGSDMAQWSFAGFTYRKCDFWTQVTANGQTFRWGRDGQLISAPVLTENECLDYVRRLWEKS